MEPVDVDGVQRALVVAAHPDDIDFGFAGIVARLTDAGIDVAYCIVTDGDAGGAESGLTRAEMATLRREEQTEAAAVVGVHELHFLGYPDGRVEPTLDLRRDLSRVVRRTRPQRVLAPSPERVIDRVYASHPDHLAVGAAAMAAVYPDARNRWAHPELVDEGWEPWTVEQMWIGGGNTGVTHFVDITTTVERKIEALLCHKSQLADPDAMADMLRAWGRAAAAAAGLPDGAAAEAVRVVDTR